MSVARVEIAGSAADPDYVFYNATIINNSQSTTQNIDDPTLVFQDTRETPLIKDASQYVVSVENFTLNGVTKSLPVFIPQIVANQSNPNLTIYTITFGLKIVAESTNWLCQVTEPVIWEPELIGNGLYVPAPTTAVPRQVESPYYYCYTYSHWVRLMNKTLARAWRKVLTNYQTPVPGVAGEGPYDLSRANLLRNATAYFPATLCPFFEFDPTTQLFSLCQDAQSSTFLGTNAGANSGDPYPATNSIPASELWGPYAQRTHADDASGLTQDPSHDGTVEATTKEPFYLNEWSYVGYNTNMEGLITNFDTKFYGAGTTFAAGIGGALTALTLPENIVQCQPDQQYYNSNIFKLIDPRTTLPFVEAHGNNTHYRLYCRETQDFTSTGTLWSPISSLVIVTSMLPVRNEISSSPITFGTSNLGTGQGSSGGFNKILLETPIDVKNAADWRDMITYEPKVATYTSLTTSQEPVQNIDLRLFWRNRLTNSLVPLQMYNSGNMNVRMLFKRKDAL
jgi:hypothetical protein